MVKDISENFRNEVKDDNFSIGEKVGINFDKKYYEGKNTRRRIMDKLISTCMEHPLTNLASFIGHERYMIPKHTKDYFKLVKAIHKGNRHGLPRILDEKRRWIRGISQILDNFEYAVITGMHVCGNQTSNIMPSNISYASSKHGLFIRYKVVIVGKMQPSNVCEPSSNIFGGGSDGKMNVCLFETELLATDLIKL